MTWSDSNPIVPIDCGGIAFLRAMSTSPETGWQSIGTSFGSSTRELFLAFAAELNRSRVAGYSFIHVVDPVTGEPVSIWSSMGEVSSCTSAMSVSSPVCVNLWSGAQANVATWSVALITPALGGRKRDVALTLKESASDAYVKFLFWK
jgi:hypothetical protein